MSAEQKNRKVEIGFDEWLGLVCKYEPIAYFQLLNVVLLMVAASFLMMHSPPVGFSLLIGLGLVFLWAFHYAWRRSLENPPWYLMPERSVAYSPETGGDKDAETDDD